MNLPEELHPVFGESAECIPGLDICQPLEIQVKAYSQNFNSGLYSETLNAGKQRKEEDFQIVNLLKETLPTLIYSGYDTKRKEPVSLLRYKKVSVNDVGDLIKETGILRSLSNKHILEFYGTVYGSTIEMIYLSFEPFDCFLSQLLCKEYQQMFETPVVKCIMLQLFNGLAYLHEKEIVHRDITPKNLVITEKGLLKISSFRNALKLGQCNDKVLTLDYSYQPVDMLLGSRTICTAIDIWSAFCIFAELILKQKLFKSPLPVGVLKEIFALLGQPTAKVWPEFTELPDYNNLDLKDCIKFNNLRKYFKGEKSEQLLSKGFYYDPKRRISAEECVMDSYFVEEPNACSIKSFGMKLHGKKFKFPVKYCLDIC